MNKSESTRLHILDHAIRRVSVSNLNDITIGDLAKSIGMSKSGLYAHFNSRENLQIAILDHTAEHFIRLVITPLQRIDDPLDRLYALPDLWPGWYEDIAQNCIYISAAFEFDDQPGVIQDRIRHHLERWLGYLIELVESLVQKSIVKPGTDSAQLVYEIYSIYLGSQYFSWLKLENGNRSRFRKSFTELLSRYLCEQQGQENER